ncbi:MAG: hypothetical protein DLM53_09650 [Candidatus Eremiobacter antarcticus]|nr:hypothetical protein [Candidatus Eremiobacteraeota bacterium]MBC5807463.1 hypothetical protein [Candidatus Eremiobacteraeota bacterium]PZR61476.1 MAG: hypothetical protein DLM53_09650 [Candidatus Eremiobacter sp. RRmetagenome_bin22]
MLSSSLQKFSSLKWLIALALVATFALSSVAPGLAETAGQRSTRNIILGGVAAVAAIVLYNNYHHKQVAHDTIVGRTRDGGIVYGDGRVVYPNGQVVYTSNDGRSLCTYDGYGQQCRPTARPYAWRYAGERTWHDNGLHKGWHKDKDKHDRDDRRDGDDR